MSASKEERDRVLSLVEAGQVTAAEASQLLDTLESEGDILYERALERPQKRIVRLQVTSPGARARRVHVTATIPISLLKVSLRLGTQMMPQLNSRAMHDLLQAIEHGETGRLLDVQDLEQGERLEVFVE
ncbi:hypothetical protein EPA93_38480 [Ktedonosporobacter rubrisoli]|uniref:YvlB/LiaX N-terminal domain-containing protein n=1 Tax=Ktedonosporobacter rubrisoli TaxID=2509675 RepID=A0A4P6K0I3_KTERU|nr:hypothetical protein [Ktedonosporobacter rubrisoli]QBD81544.1 hypothetical protein EPA93_38480 [Ktedonosporobacter rubrisoli]